MNNQKSPRPLNISERLAMLEVWRDGVGEQAGAAQRLNGIEENLYATSRWMRAITEMLGGPEAVQAVMDRQRNEDLDKLEAEQKAGVQKLLDENKIVATDVIGPRSVVVASENLPDGTVISRRAFFRVPNIPAQAQTDFIGKGIGAEVQAQSQGGHQVIYRVLEIYETVQQPTPPADGAGEIQAAN